MITACPVPDDRASEWEDGHGTGIPEWMQSGDDPYWRRIFCGSIEYQRQERARG